MNGEKNYSLDHIFSITVSEPDPHTLNPEKKPACSIFEVNYYLICLITF
jgi:hypothetical protein